MLHEPVVSTVEDNAISYKMRVGVIMFIVYALVYAGFVAINVVSPMLMEVNILGGLNLAVVYGFGLIIFALILALLYNSMCVKMENKLNKNAPIKEEQ